MRKIIEYCLVSADGIVLDDPFPFRDYDDDACLRDRLGTFAALRRDLVGPDHIREICEEVAPERGDPPICRASQCDPKVRFFVEAGDSRVE